MYFDGLFPVDVLDALDGEFPEPSAEISHHLFCKNATERGWRCIKDKGRGYLKITNSNESAMAEHLNGVITAMKSRSFVTFLEQLTGIGPLIVDQTNEGSGQHQILPGGSLQIHADFNRVLSGLYRRVNVFLYLNHDWQPSWAGDLELWDHSMTKCAARIAPLRNRLVVFSSTDFSYHGHADPLRCPSDRSRRSIALYYYTESPAALVDEDRHSTLYQVRKCESCQMPHVGSGST